MNHSRFSFDDNVLNTGTYKRYQNPLWPPSAMYLMYTMDLTPYLPSVEHLDYRALEELRHSIETELVSSNTLGRKKREDYYLREYISEKMLTLSQSLSGTDRRALEIRSDAIREGYTLESLQELTSIRPKISIVAGNISTWYGKAVAGRPTAFGCVTNDETNEAIILADKLVREIDNFVKTIDPSLSVQDAPEFESADIFFMCGEGNTYPKHFAYFVPEDEGIKYSPFKKTYYFNNLHRFMYEHLSIPLHEAICGSAQSEPEKLHFTIPALWMRGHDYGHFVCNSTTSYEDINSKNRWISVVLQEVSADVFGTLFLLGPWCECFPYSREDAVRYYISESLRYIHRGVGLFPDSDGMYLQLSYLTSNGFVESDGIGNRLTIAYQSDEVYRGLIQLAQELSRSFLSAKADPAIELFNRYGPSSGNLDSLTNRLRAFPPTAINYMQEGHSHRVSA